MEARSIDYIPFPHRAARTALGVVGGRLHYKLKGRYEMAKYYIAYGSNMDEGQMAYRCPTARLLGRTELEDYRILFKGSKTGAYATIEPEEGSRVPIIVWKIGKEDEKSLDRYEGYPVFYYKKKLEIDLDGKRVTAMVYIMDESREYGKPSERYYGVLERAYRKYGFSMEILTEAYEISEKK